MQLREPGAPFDDILLPYRDVDRTVEGRPWVLANMVGGLDGSASIGGRVAELSGGTDAELFRLMRSLADVVMVGAQTVRAEGYGPVDLSPEVSAERGAAGRKPTPAVAVITRSVQLDWGSRLFTESPAEARPIVITTAGADAEQRDRASRVATVLVAGEHEVDLADALQQLHDLGHAVVLCEGGPTVLGQLAAEDLLDELCLTIAPMMGGDPLPIAVNPLGARVSRFAVCHVAQDADTLFLRYQRSSHG